MIIATNKHVITVLNANLNTQKFSLAKSLSPNGLIPKIAHRLVCHNIYLTSSLAVLPIYVKPFIGVCYFDKVCNGIM